MADTPAQEAAADLAGDFLAAVEPYTEEAEAEGNEATDEVEQPQEEEATTPEFTWETPEELKDLLEAPDFEDDEEDDEAAYVTQNEVREQLGYESEYDDDPEKARLQKQLAKMQKKLAWAEEQKAKANIKNWREEGRKYFQFANVDAIEAKSRRAFLKEAQRQHEQVAKVVKPQWEAIQAEKARIREQALAEGRAEAEKRWGAPSTGPTTAANYSENTETVRRERLGMGQSLTNVIKQKGYLKNL